MRQIAAKRKKGANFMTDIVKNYIGLECLIYTMNSTQLTGVIKTVEGNWMTVEKGNSVEAINLDYVIRIREFPKTVKGKKKSIVLD